MKQRMYILFIVMCLSTATWASPGDTTWIQAHKGTQLNYYNDFDTLVAFPNGSVSYRKIIMVFTLGKYKCPNGSQYCGDWDYTIQNFLLKGNDTLELSRLITPYANASYPRTPWTWQQRYMFDVTDFYPLLKDSAKIRLHYSGYSGGFTADIKFAFIEGTPPRNVLGIEPTWNGSFAYGKASDPIGNHLPTLNPVAPTGTRFGELKFTATGHGSDANGCGEFCNKYYQVVSKGKVVQKTNLWRNDCGSNELYPQSGTWIYNRANWCPGSLINPNVHKIPNVFSDSMVNVGITYQPYTSTGAASYTIASALFFYDSVNYLLDASLERIVSPSDYEGNYRENPMCGKPVVSVKNTGSAVINSIQFTYGVVGLTPQQYTLTGIALASMKDTLITLPDLGVISTMSASNLSTFRVIINQVNGVVDGYQQNDTLTSNFATAPDWPNQIKIVIKSNNNSSETSWKIVDLNNTVVMKRNPSLANTVYTDTISNLASGCYKLVVSDVGCDGLNWWGNSSTVGTGYIYVQNSAGKLLHLTNGLPDYPSSTSQDFGCGFTQYFRVGTLLSVDQINFVGKGDGKINHLFWKTNNEKDVSYFEIEYSTDENRFEKVGQVKAVGNTIGNTSYSFDHHPESNQESYFYRLRMVDKDGAAKYSDEVSIKPSFGNYSIQQIVPNPFLNSIQLSVTSIKQEKAVIKIFDVQGRVQQTKTIELQKGLNNLVVDGLSKLTKGVYMLSVEANGQQLIEKLIKE